MDLFGVATAVVSFGVYHRSSLFGGGRGDRGRRGGGFGVSFVGDLPALVDLHFPRSRCGQRCIGGLLEHRLFYRIAPLFYHLFPHPHLSQPPLHLLPYSPLEILVVPLLLLRLTLAAWSSLRFLIPARRDSVEGRGAGGGAGVGAGSERLPGLVAESTWPWLV